MQVFQREKDISCDVVVKDGQLGDMIEGYHLVTIELSALEYH